jgi:hypothetical protein
MKAKDPVPLANEMISLLELKLLVKSIVNKHADIRIKCLLEGGTWQEHFFIVLMVTEQGIVLSDETNSKIKSIRFLDAIRQFVIDKPFDSYNSNLAYNVSGE